MGFLNIIKKKSDFRRVYSRGRIVAGYGLVIYYLPNNLETSRVGFVVGKKVGSAVERNRVRRVLREICRLNQEKFLDGNDYIVVARRGIVGKSYQEISKILLENLEKKSR